MTEAHLQLLDWNLHLSFKNPRYQRSIANTTSVLCHCRQPPAKFSEILAIISKTLQCAGYAMAIEL